MSSLNDVAGGPPAESVFDLGARLTQLLADASQEAVNGQLPMAIRDRVADVAECIRRRTAVKADRDPRTLFDLDERFVELMEQADEEASESGAVSAELLQEITEYLEAFRVRLTASHPTGAGRSQLSRSAPKKWIGFPLAGSSLKRV